ncbi:hypothetical protein LguiB_027831 [Lonicera macranthoides]
MKERLVVRATVNCPLATISAISGSSAPPPPWANGLTSLSHFFPSARGIHKFWATQRDYREHRFHDGKCGGGARPIAYVPQRYLIEYIGG